MTREEAKNVLYEWQEMMVRNGVPIDTSKVQALRVAIEVLSKPIVDITQRDLCADISCTDCPFMKETCKLMDYVAYADRPKGEWLDTGDPLMRTCSNCGYGVLIQNVNNFCPNCGAKMKGGDNE